MTDWSISLKRRADKTQKVKRHRRIEGSKNIEKDHIENFYIEFDHIENFYIENDHIETNDIEFHDIEINCIQLKDIEKLHTYNPSFKILKLKNK